MTLFHVSEEPDITVFEPRWSALRAEPVVWAIDDEHLRNYLVPRDCPRVTYAASSHTTAADRERFLGSSRAVLAIEMAWLDRMRSSRLYCYAFPGDTFELADECAGYFVSRITVKPMHTEVIDDPMAAVLERGVDVRVLPSQALWTLRDAVIESTLAFSIIRWGNALPRPGTVPATGARAHEIAR
jgi:hypothetical protein